MAADIGFTVGTFLLFPAAFVLMGGHSLGLVSKGQYYLALGVGGGAVLALGVYKCLFMILYPTVAVEEGITMPMPNSSGFIRNLLTPSSRSGARAIGVVFLVVMALFFGVPTVLFVTTVL